MEPTGSSIYNDPSLIAARTAAQSATSAAGTESAAAISLPDQLRAALNSKFSTDNPIYAQKEGALKDYLNMTTQAPLNVTPKSAGGTSDVIYNPAQQANLIQQYRSPSVARMATLNDLLGLSTGGIENIIGATSRAHQGEVAGLNAKAQTADQAYRDILGELSKRAEEAYQNKQLALESQRINLSSLGGVQGIRSQQLVTDLKNGLELKPALTKYAGILDPNQIYQIYNTVHSAPGDAWGPAKETPTELAGLGIKANDLTNSQQDFQNISKGLDAFLSTRNSTNIAQRLNPFDPAGMKIGSQQAILTQMLAKLVEKNRLSDADRKFYLSQMPAPWMDNAQAQAKIDGIKAGIKSKLGISDNSSGGSEWQ